MRTSVCFLLLGILVLLAARNGNAVKNFTGVLGQNITLQCPRTKTTDVTRLYIQKGDGANPVFINGFYTGRELPVELKYKYRTFVNRKDLSMEMTNLSFSDEGLYKCIVFYTSQDREEFKLLLKVTAEYNVPNLTVEKCDEHNPVTGEKRCTLTCSSTGGYPQSKVTWPELNLSLISYVHNNSFQDPTSKTWTIIQTISYPCNKPTNISCSVDTSVSNIVSICVNGPDDEKFPLDAAVISAIVVVLLIIFILLAVYIIKRWRARRRLPPDDPDLGLPLDDCHSQPQES
ncbi:T-lymphocyte activation antigen CD80 isoform X1 [Paramisgurnus dabryanus]|uniref:T-lymphocyte activation antigen CD80 isoform X1 n=1 Tax=Paramisgurnus dabryanus TaxID=90735 RepID=UPI0031F3E09B